MSDFTLTSGNSFAFKPQSYICPKHGLVEELGWISLNDGTREISRHCMKCYQEWIAANIPTVEMK